MIRILFVCYGNICRSTMAQSVMTELVRRAGLTGRFEIDSAATSDEEIGNGLHPGTQRTLKRYGIPCVPHRARQMTKADYDRFDLLIGMEKRNLRDMTAITGGDPEGKIERLLERTDDKRDIADPWYTGDFETTYADVLKGCKALLESLRG